ncbi:MAG: hypothetical protein ACRC0G_13030 [Fusobacteriaceae bacterium]
MHDEEFRDLFLKMLNKDDGVIKERFKQFLYSIPEENKILDCTDEVEKLKFEKDELQKKLIQFEIESEEKDSVIENLKESIIKVEIEQNEKTEKIKKLKELLNDEKLKFYQEKIIFDLYQSIDGMLKEDLQGVFKVNCMEDFFCCGVQARNVDSLWDIAKESILTKDKNAKKVVYIFEYFLRKYNRTFENSVYIISDVEIDDKFEPENHISTNTINGYIEQILLRGYSDRSKKIIKKSVVSLY